MSPYVGLQVPQERNESLVDTTKFECLSAC